MHVPWTIITINGKHQQKEKWHRNCLLGGIVHVLVVITVIVADQFLVENT